MDFFFEFLNGLIVMVILGNLRISTKFQIQLKSSFYDKTPISFIVFVLDSLFIEIFLN